MKKVVLVLLGILMMVSLSACFTSKSPVEHKPETIGTSLKDKVTYTVEDRTNICLLRFTNGADVTVEVEVNFVFDNEGNKQDAGYGHLYCLAPGEIGAISMRKPTNEHGIPIDGVTTEFNVAISKNGLFDSSGSYDEFISIEDSSEDGEVTIVAHNSSDVDIDDVTVAIIYYNGEEAVWYDDYGYDLAAGGEYYWTFSKPHFYDSDSTEIPFDRYEILLNDSFNFK